jgi:hypothetical protein
MNEIITDFMVGTTLSSIPIYVLTKYYFENKLTLKDFNFEEAVMYLPIKMGFINVFLFLIMRQISPALSANPVVYGLLLSTILSMLTKSFNEIPEKVIKMENSNMYHIYSAVIFTICYFIVMKIIKKN